MNTVVSLPQSIKFKRNSAVNHKTQTELLVNVKEFMVFIPPFFRYKVTVVAKEYASPVASGKRITSEIAGALWEWPPAVCGRHTDEKSLERSKVWCMDSYGKFMELAMNPKETGAYLRQSVFYFKNKVNVDLARPILIRISSVASVIALSTDCSVFLSRTAQLKY